MTPPVAPLLSPCSRDRIGRILLRVVYEPTGCWSYRGAHHRGRPIVREGGRQVYVHRVLFAEFRGVGNLDLHHLCGNVWCVNFDHLLRCTRAAHNYMGKKGWAAFALAG